MAIAQDVSCAAPQAGTNDDRRPGGAGPERRAQLPRPALSGLIYDARSGEQPKAAGLDLRLARFGAAVLVVE